MGMNMPTDANISRLILQLTRATSEGQLKWELREPPGTLRAGSDDVIVNYLQTVHKGQVIGLFQRRYRSYSGDLDRFFWNESLVLAFIDRRGNVIWEHDEPSSTLHDLFSLARESAADVDGILKRLLSED
jgi:hypothetical protein